MLRSIQKRQGRRRSPHWRTVRAEHLKKQPECQACGTTDSIQVHHIAPFHLHPELELAPGNLITLCEKRSHDCHLRLGHFFDWSLFNPVVIQDAAQYRKEYEEARRALVESTPPA